MFRYDNLDDCNGNEDDSDRVSWIVNMGFCSSEDIRQILYNDMRIIGNVRTTYLNQ